MQKCHSTEVHRPNKCNGIGDQRRKRNAESKHKYYAFEHFSDLLIIGVPTSRNIAGLALSSRNNLLSLEELSLASNIYKELYKIKTNFSLNNLDLLANEAKQNLTMLGFNVDYLDYLDAFTLDEVTSSTSTIIIAIAVYLGEIRLIDNILVNEV